jgi:hypothetical protein
VYVFFAVTLSLPSAVIGDRSDFLDDTSSRSSIETLRLLCQVDNEVGKPRVFFVLVFSGIIVMAVLVATIAAASKSIRRRCIFQKYRMTCDEMTVSDDSLSPPTAWIYDQDHRCIIHSYGPNGEPFVIEEIDEDDGKLVGKVNSFKAIREKAVMFLV